MSQGYIYVSFLSLFTSKCKNPLPICPMLFFSRKFYHGTAPMDYKAEHGNGSSPSPPSHSIGSFPLSSPLHSSTRGAALLRGASTVTTLSLAFPLRCWSWSSKRRGIGEMLGNNLYINVSTVLYREHPHLIHKP